MTANKLLNYFPCLQNRDGYSALFVEILGRSTVVWYVHCGKHFTCTHQTAASIILTINISSDDGIRAHHSGRKCIAKRQRSRLLKKQKDLRFLNLFPLHKDTEAPSRSVPFPLKMSCYKESVKIMSCTVRILMNFHP